MFSLLRITTLALTLAVATGCISKPVLNPSQTLATTPAYMQTQLQRTILLALAERGWSPRGVTPRQIQADITVRDTFFAAVDIDYSPQGYSIRYRNSRNLGYENDNIHRNYNRWVSNLFSSIRRQLVNYDTQRLLDAQPGANR